MTFQALKASLEGSSFLGAGLANLVKTHSVEQLLDARDVREFDALWTAANAEVEAAAEKVDSDDNPYEVSRLAYAAAFDATGSGDLAGYVSDDFELLGRALASHASSDFLCALWWMHRSVTDPSHRSESGPPRLMRPGQQRRPQVVSTLAVILVARN